MKVSYKWLSEYVDLQGFTAEELAEKLTRSGIEVDIVESLNKGVSGVVVGYVKAKTKHPDADKLNVCTVDVGSGEDLQIVCGAKNVDAGQKVPVAVIGAVLPGDFKIKRAKLRGVESQGMICSAKELGMNDKLLPKEIQEGILVLPASTEVGLSILDVLTLDDQVLEMELTPNRSDCLSMIGTAYEIGAILGRPVQLPEDKRHPNVEMSTTKAEDRISVKIDAQEACTQYAARLIEGVTVGTSPLWMQSRLMAAGVRPINNIVDVTNYVMLEYGQPLHAFDADQVDSGRIVVRLAHEGEKMVTLDDIERTLEPHMLLVTDGIKPIAIAGVMGGANSEVTEGTTNILLESARFAGPSVRKTSRQLGLRSEASLRFEKEVNPEAVISALDRAAALLVLCCGGKVAQGIVQEIGATYTHAKIALKLDRVNHYLGTDLSIQQVKEILDRLGLEYGLLDGGSLIVQIPGRRGDITRDVDLIEEIARLYGYDNIPTTLMTGVTTPGSLTREQALRRTISRLLTGSGLHEVITYTLSHRESTADYPGLYPQYTPIPLAMPMSEDRSVLRTTIVPHLLETVTYNRNRKNDDVAIFEAGTVFLSEEAEAGLTKQPQEKRVLGIAMTGSRTGSHWQQKQKKVDFYDIKGVFERITSYLGLHVEYRSAQKEGFHPGRTAELILVTSSGERQPIGYMGQLHPTLQKKRDLEDTYVLEAELGPILQHADYEADYKLLPRYPSASRDMALVVDAAVPVGELEKLAAETAGELLESIRVFDVYTGERLGEGKKSIAFALVYRHPDRTLQDEEVAQLHEGVVKALETAFGAELRK
ncbi:phenylalanine--tRNA ligase subunit beta [Paenibacillus lutrae]|uniref:Phenylalanine--tRNA ligase beta subunit n=1 Tax=Paenibacillus lutrae TaxID=2078573 RepID=A0A7X3FGA6_9BACL|nr:phenylalanine--tRNA ligase subunit beta [Paenibacillus lutrae]MVO98938.1 phenylalanine--tRNA ligase subunit beta [Paenibacillus lutrae]